MLKLAGALLSKPQVLERAARMKGKSGTLGVAASPVVKDAARIAAEGGSDLLGPALFGAGVNTAISTLATGNPLIGLAVGAADLGVGFGAAKALGRYAPNLAGKYKSYVSADDMAKYAGSKSIPTSALSRVYEPSAAQHAVMIGSNLAVPMAVESLLMRGQQDQVTNQNVTQQQQLGQQEYLNQMYAPPYTADGTLYQLQGLPQRVI